MHEIDYEMEAVMSSGDKAEWRQNRDPEWTKDVGYALQDGLGKHAYRTDLNGSKPSDPGWHECSCGWEGYWSSFQPHVADYLRSIALTTSPPDALDAVKAAAWDEGYWLGINGHTGPGNPYRDSGATIRTHVLGDNGMRVKATSTATNAVTGEDQRHDNEGKTT